MTQSPKLTLVIPFRDRDAKRVQRCLDSLRRQSYDDFAVLFVDYGSDPSTARRTRELVSTYQFCHYLYSDSRGYPWSRSRALNAGGRRATSPYLALCDVDLVFSSNFVEVVAAHAGDDRVLYCYPHFLPPEFDGWAHLNASDRTLKKDSKQVKGGCLCLPTRIFQTISGYDEYYVYWGREDVDFADRLDASGLEACWISDETTVFHQWHTPVDYHTTGYMPASVWGRMCSHFCRHAGKIVRNADNWGRLLTVEDRPVMQYLDFENGRLLDGKGLVVLDLPPDDMKSIGDFVRTFWDLPAGHGIAVTHTRLEPPSRRVDLLARRINAALRLPGSAWRVDHGRNPMTDFLPDFIEYNADIVADYYLGFPARNGTSIVVRS